MDSLPDELILIISNYLNFKDLIRLTSTNKRFNYLLKDKYKNCIEYKELRHDYSLGFYLTGTYNYLTEDDKKYINFVSEVPIYPRLINNFEINRTPQSFRVLFCRNSNTFNGGYITSSCKCGKEYCSDIYYKINPYYTTNDLIMAKGKLNNKLEPYFKNASKGLIKGITRSSQIAYLFKDVGNWL